VTGLVAGVHWVRRESAKRAGIGMASPPSLAWLARGWKVLCISKLKSYPTFG
jgi:hypothetical protein